MDHCRGMYEFHIAIGSKEPISTTARKNCISGFFATKSKLCAEVMALFQAKRVLTRQHFLQIHICTPKMLCFWVHWPTRSTCRSQLKAIFRPSVLACVLLRPSGPLVDLYLDSRSNEACVVQSLGQSPQLLSKACALRWMQREISFWFRLQKYARIQKPW